MRFRTFFALALSTVPWMAAQPVIRPVNGIQNAMGYQTTLAPDCLFAVFGTGLGPATLTFADGQNYQTSLAGTSISFKPVGGGAVIPARLVYTLATQVAGLLPSSIAPGAYAVTVTYRNVNSAPQNVAVVARSLGIDTVDTSGYGPAQANVGNVNNGLSLVRFTSGTLPGPGFTWTLTPAHPGDAIVLWGTGGGADPANDSGGSSGDQTAAGNFKVLVDGVTITPFYSGTATLYPGLWQVNFYLPQDITPDCFAAVQVAAPGTTSNMVTIAIAPPGQDSCSDPQLNTASLAKLDAGGTIVGADFGLYKFPTQEMASGQFGRYAATEVALRKAGQRFGACLVTDIKAVAASKYPAAPDSLLDAGSSLPFAGPGLPAGSSLLRITGPYYGDSLLPGTLRAGTYTITGLGGPDIGPFSASVRFPSDFTATNLDSIDRIDRTQPLMLTWSGLGMDRVRIQVATNVQVGGTADDPVTRNVAVQCDVDGGLGAYTIPPEALALLQPTDQGNIQIGAYTSRATFTAPLVAGGEIDYGQISYNPTDGIVGVIVQ